MERLNNEDRLSAYFDGELSSNERSEMEERLRSSPDLRRTLEDFQLQRQWLAVLPTPALSVGFSNRVMERVLAAAPVAIPIAPPIAPPPFPVTEKRRSYSVIVGFVLSTAALVAVGLFIADKFRNAAKDNPLVVQKENEPVEDSSAAVPKESTPDSRVNSTNPNNSIVASDPKISVEPNAPTNDTPGEITPVVKGSMEKEPVENVASGNAKSSNANPGANKDSNARLIANSANSHSAATTKTRPKAYHVQIGTRSQFDSRLKDAGVTVIASKSIDPPTDVPRAQAVDVSPDPEYVIVEGSEEQLAELIKKLGEQADLALTEPKGDLEADMLIEAICRMDAAAKSLRPSEAKEGDFTAFTLPPKALRPIIPAGAPSNGPSSTVPLPAGPKLAPPPPDSPKSAETGGEILYVPRVLFIVNIRMSELPTPAK